MANGIFPGWRVVAGSGVGIAFGSVVFASAGFAQLAGAWGRTFHWNQSQLATAATIYLFLQMATYPVFGWLLDRWGSRRVATASIGLFGLSLLALSQVGDSLTQLYAAFALIGLLSAGTNVVSYARALSLWFDRKRGMALGLAASSQAVGAVLIPIVVSRVIAASGWTDAVLLLAAFELIVCMPLVWLLVRDSPLPYGLLPDGDSQVAVPGAAAPSKPVLAGMTRGEVLRSVTFWKLALCFMVMGLTAYAIAINLLFILGKTAGLSPIEVAGMQAAGGAAVLVGRVGFGYLLDRLRAPIVGVLSLVMAATGIAIYANSTSHGVILVGALVLGCCVGGESDLMPYLASRYFGTQALSSVFGWFLSIFFVGAAIGPKLFASIAMSQSGVVDALYVLIGLQVVPVVLFLSLGRYPSMAGRAELAGTGIAAEVGLPR